MNKQIAIETLAAIANKEIIAVNAENVKHIEYIKTLLEREMGDE